MVEVLSGAVPGRVPGETVGGVGRTETFRERDPLCRNTEGALDAPTEAGGDCSVDGLVGDAQLGQTIETRSGHGVLPSACS